MASFALRDDASDAGSVASGFSSVSAGVGGGRLGSSTYHGRGTAPMRQAAGVSSRRPARGGFGSGGVPGGSVAGSSQHVPLTAQVRTSFFMIPRERVVDRYVRLFILWSLVCW